MTTSTESSTAGKPVKSTFVYYLRLELIYQGIKALLTAILELISTLN